MVKRFTDFYLSFFLIFVLSWLFFIIAMVLKIKENHEPILFKQKRVGLKGKLFSLYKFRTMTSRSVQQSDFEAGSNLRVTPIGAILRKTKLDELPQLYNVLRGDMSLVGPRPEVAEWTKVYPEKWRIVHSVRPGITDNASIVFRNEEDILRNSDNPSQTYQNVILPQKLNEYISYVENQSFTQDLKILFKTLNTVIFK
jgi:lipopolysaccharide/colanic/teichoic acid biosynthesis glycosyltransferase